MKKSFPFVDQCLAAVRQTNGLYMKLRIKEKILLTLHFSIHVISGNFS